ncbi:MAG: DUF2189 domain-containing protein [Erythrobacter sp.]
MSTLEAPPVAPPPAPPARVVSDLALRDLAQALGAGWRDFLGMPQFGLFFGGVYVLTGLAIGWVALAGGELAWLIPAIAGFPLVAPFVAVGLYEASRRREVAEVLSWRGVLGALKGHGDDQILSMGVIVFVAFSFWMIVAHAIFAIFMAESGLGGESLDAFLTPAGLSMLAVGSAVGGIMALGFYAMTVISLPMLVDRKVDFLTAIIASFKVVRGNLFVMLAWAAVIAALLIVAMIPAFLGLMIVLPVLGHATWHLYRRAVL